MKRIGDATPFVDAFTTVASVAAMALSVKRFAEQWHIWVAVDVFSVYMWALDLRAGSDNWATLLMWCVYLMNAVVMLVKWEKEARRGNAV
ncbi:MAG: nicotinamide mononucleotide transporter [Thermoguttaceae bacterium]|nr:nicotinamide mononucleotide transporter [Thermoguttaceae bacterium]